MDKNPIPDYWYKVFLQAVKNPEKKIPAEESFWMAKDQIDASLPQQRINLSSGATNGEPVAGDAGASAQ